MQQTLRHPRPKCLLCIIIVRRSERYTLCSVPSNLTDRPNHLICHLMSCPILYALSLLQHGLCIIPPQKKKLSNISLSEIIVVTALFPVDKLLKWNRPLIQLTVSRDCRIICVPECRGSRRPRNHTLYDILPIRSVFQATQADPRSSLMMAGTCRSQYIE
jgi:hypothetical protein